MEKEVNWVYWVNWTDCWIESKVLPNLLIRILAIDFKKELDLRPLYDINNNNNEVVYFRSRTG